MLSVTLDATFADLVLNSLIGLCVSSCDRLTSLSHMYTHFRERSHVQPFISIEISGCVLFLCFIHPELGRQRQPPSKRPTSPCSSSQ